MSRKVKLILALTVVVAALGYLFITAFSSSTMYYFTVDEALAKGQSVYGKPMRVSGEVIGSSIDWDPMNMRLGFDVREQGEALHVLFRGARPDNFIDKAKVILEGRIDSDGVFQADKLMLSCPSKYESKLEGDETEPVVNLQ